MLEQEPIVVYQRSPEDAFPPADRATIHDWLAIPEEERAELIHGCIVYHAFPGPAHGHAQRRLGVQLDPYTRRGGGGGGPRSAPGGWWITLEVDMEIGDVACRPDIVGWRRDKHTRCPQPDARGVCIDVPDFVCEVLSRSTARHDQGDKRVAYFEAGVEHYWLVDTANGTLTVLRRSEPGYVVVLSAGRGDVVQAPPFEKVKVVVADRFLDDDEPAPAAAPAPKRRPSTAVPAKRKRATPVGRGGAAPGARDVGTASPSGGRARARKVADATAPATAPAAKEPRPRRR